MNRRGGAEALIAIICLVVVVSFVIGVGYQLSGYQSPDLQSVNNAATEVANGRIDVHTDDTSSIKTGTVVPGLYGTSYLSHGSSVTLTVKAPHSGSYSLFLSSNSASGSDPNAISLSVNGGQTTILSFTVLIPNCKWYCLQTPHITVKLNQGRNTITIMNNEVADAPDCASNTSDSKHCNYILGVTLKPQS